MKYLNEEDTKFKGPEHYYSLKKRFNRPDINDWYEKIYRQPYSIGYVSELLKKFRPKDYENAYDMYVVSGIVDTDLPKDKRGRTKEELEELALQWKERSGVDLPLVDFYDALVLHAVVETYDGLLMEFKAMEMYEKFGFITEGTDGDTDRSCGIDFVAKKDDKTLLVQVKPISFFRGEKPDLVSDRVAVITTKHRLGLEKFPDSSYTYMIYDKEKKWLNKDGRFNFRYSELVDERGKMKVNIDSEEYKHEER